MSFTSKLETTTFASLHPYDIIASYYIIILHVKNQWSLLNFS